MNTEQIILIFLWILYLGSHSLFAAPGIKKVSEKLLGKSYRYYRIIYVIFSTLFLGIIAFYLFSMDQVRLYRPNIVSIYSGVLLCVLGIIIIQKSFNQYDLGEFIGTFYISEGPEHENKLKTSGILSRVRHPLYTATLLIASGYILYLPTVASLTSGICIALYLFIGIRLEERKLLAEFGDDYRQYRKKVPMLFPGIRDLFGKAASG